MQIQVVHPEMGVIHARLPVEKVGSDGLLMSQPNWTVLHCYNLKLDMFTNKQNLHHVQMILYLQKTLHYIFHKNVNIFIFSSICYI